MRHDAIVRLTFALVACASSVVAAADEAGGEGEIQPVPEVQIAIDRATHSPTEAEFFRRIATLVEVKERHRLDEESLTRQVIRHMARVDGADPQATGMAVYSYRLLRALDISPDDQLRAIEPYLSTKDERLRSVVYSLLRVSITHVDTGGSGGAPSFPAFRRRFPPTGEPPAAVVVYLFRLNPRAAMETLLDVEAAAAPGKREEFQGLYRSERVVAHVEHLRTCPDRHKALAAALAAANELTGDRRWWVRLYVAEMARRHQDLRQPELLARLRADANPLVRAEVDYSGGDAPKVGDRPTQ